MKSRLTRIAVALLLGLATCACSEGTSVAPSVMPTPEPSAQPTRQARSLPSGLDETWVRTVLQFDSAGLPQRWEGGTLRVCVDDRLEVGLVRWATEEISRLSGVPAVFVGDGCNVRWILDSSPGYSHASLSGNFTSITSVTITIREHSREVSTIILHEAGHVLGLKHSPDRRDVMHETPRSEKFSADEERLIRWLFER